MAKFYISKVVQYALVLLFITTLNFLLPRAMPGDPLTYIVGEDIVLMTPAQRQEAMERHGLNKPLVEQYADYIRGILSGDLGYSYQRRRPIADMVAERLPWTLLLQSLNIVLSTFIGVVFGTVAAWRRGGKADIALSNIFVFFRSMPSFWVGMILVAFFSAHLGWLPVFGARTIWAQHTGIAWVLDVARHAALPLATLVILSVSSIFLIMRYSMIDVLAEDFMHMAKMKGLGDKRVRLRHGMRNALIPVVTVVMMNIGFMVGGSVVIETVFAYPGMGRLMFEAVSFRDYATIQACVLIMTLCVIAANIVADMLYPLLDPRVV